MYIWFPCQAKTFQGLEAQSHAGLQLELPETKKVCWWLLFVLVCGVLYKVHGQLAGSLGQGLELVFSACVKAMRACEKSYAGLKQKPIRAGLPMKKP